MIPRIVHVDGDGYMDIRQFSDIINIKKVAYYSLELVSDNRLNLYFYDKNKKLVKPRKKYLTKKY